MVNGLENELLHPKSFLELLPTNQNAFFEKTLINKLTCIKSGYRKMKWTNKEQIYTMCIHWNRQFYAAVINLKTQWLKTMMLFFMYTDCLFLVVWQQRCLCCHLLGVQVEGGSILTHLNNYSSRQRKYSESFDIFKTSAWKWHSSSTLVRCSHIWVQQGVWSSHREGRRVFKEQPFALLNQWALGSYQEFLYQA